MRIEKKKSAKVDASHSRAQATQSDEEDEDDQLLQCIMCNCTTIEDYLKRHIRYNHLICKDDIIEKLYKLHYPPESSTISTQTDVTWVHGDKHKKQKHVEQEEQEDYSDGGGMEEAAEDHGMDNNHDASDEEEVLCPACGDVEDGTAMIACDLCDRWYHWVCVGVTATPAKGQEWICNGCGKDSDHFGKRTIKTTADQEEMMDVRKIKEEYPRGRMCNRSASRASRDDDIKVTAVVRPRRGDLDPGSPSHESTPKAKKKTSSPVRERMPKKKKVQTSPVPEPEPPKKEKKPFKYASRRYKADLSPETSEYESEISPDDDPDFDAKNEHVDRDDMKMYIKSSKKGGGKSKPKPKARRKSSLDDSNIDDMSRDELREMCKKECLKASGSREELLTRLRQSRNMSSNRSSKTQQREQERQISKEKEKKKLNSTKHKLEEITDGDGTDDDFCKICFLGADLPEDLELGPLYKYGVCQAHLHCLMFSSGLIQTGEDDEGIHGFMPDEIVNEWRRGGKLKCSYCKEIYATVGCSVRTCLKTYHLPCGIKNGALHEYFGNFDSYCNIHRNTRPNKNKHQKDYVLTDVGLVPGWVDKEAENDRAKKGEVDGGKKNQVKSKKKPSKKEDEDEDEEEDEDMNSSNKTSTLSKKKVQTRRGDDSKTSEEDEDTLQQSKATKRRTRDKDDGKKSSEEEEDIAKISKGHTRKKRKSNEDEVSKKSSSEEEDSHKKLRNTSTISKKKAVKNMDTDNKSSEDEETISKVIKGSKRKTKFQKKRNRVIKDDEDSDGKGNSSDDEDKKRQTRSKSEDEKETLWETMANKSPKGKKEDKPKLSSSEEDFEPKSKITKKRHVSDDNDDKEVSSVAENDEEKGKEREKEKERLWKNMAMKVKYPKDKEEHSDDAVKKSDNDEEEGKMKKRKPAKINKKPKGDSDVGGEDSKTHSSDDETPTKRKSKLKHTTNIDDLPSDNDVAHEGFEPHDESEGEEENKKKTNRKGGIKKGKTKTHQESVDDNAEFKESDGDNEKNTKKKRSNIKDKSKTGNIVTNQESDDDKNDAHEGFESHGGSDEENNKFEKLITNKENKNKKAKGKAKNHHKDDDNDTTPEGYEASEGEEEKKPNKKKINIRGKNKRGQAKNFQESDDNDVAPEGYESHDESEQEKGKKTLKKKINIKDKNKQAHQESDDNQVSDDENSAKKGASTSRPSRKNGIVSKMTMEIVDETSETKGRPSRNCQKKIVEDDGDSDENQRSNSKIVDETSETKGRPSRNCRKKSFVEEDGDSDENQRSSRKRRQVNLTDKGGSGVERPSRKCSKNAIVEEDEEQDKAEKIPFRKSNRKSVNTENELGQNDEPSIEDKLRLMEVESGHEEKDSLQVNEDTSDEENSNTKNIKPKKNINVHNDSENKDQLSEVDEEEREERRKEMEKEKLWKSMALKSTKTTSEKTDDDHFNDSKERQSEEENEKDSSKTKKQKKGQVKHETWEIQDQDQDKDCKKKTKDKLSESESNDEIEKPAIKLRINTKTLKSKKKNEGEWETINNDQDDIFSEKTFNLNDATEDDHISNNIDTFKENFEQNDGGNDCADLPSISTEKASINYMDVPSDDNEIDFSKILESLNTTTDNLNHQCYHFQCTLCTFNNTNKDVIDDHIRVQHKKRPGKTLSKKKEMMVYVEPYQLSEVEKALAEYEMKNGNHSSGTYLRRLMEHFSFFRWVSDDMPQEIVELGDRVYEQFNSDAQSTSSEGSLSKAKRRISKRPLKDKDFVDWNEVNPKKLKKDRIANFTRDEENVSEDSETIGQLNISKPKQAKGGRNSRHQNEPEEDSPIPQNGTTSPLPTSSMAKHSHSPRSSSQSPVYDERRSSSLSPSNNSTTERFECHKCGTKIKLTESLVVKHLNRHKMTMKDYVSFCNGEDNVPVEVLKWQEEEESLSLLIPMDHKDKNHLMCSICDKVFKSKNVLKTHMTIHEEQEEKKDQDNTFKGFVDETCVTPESDIPEKVEENLDLTTLNASPSNSRMETQEPVSQCFSPGRRIAEIPDTEELNDIYMAKYTDEKGFERIWVEEFNADGMPGLYVNGKATGSVDVAEIRKAMELKANIPERFERMVFKFMPKESPKSEYKSKKDLLKEMDKLEEERKPKPKIILKLPRQTKK